LHEVFSCIPVPARIMEMTKDDIEPRQDETRDTLTCGNLSIFQKIKGYRYSIDAYLIAAFVEEIAGTTILEIGSGSGVVSILLASMKGLHMTGVEIQKGLAEMSVRSVEMAGLSDKVRIVNCDIQVYSGPRVEVVVTNPPFRALDTGKINPNPEKAIARHELSLDLEGLLRKTHELLMPGGRFYIVYPAWRMPDLISSMRANRLEPKRVQYVHSTVISPAEICLVSGLRDGGKECTIERPLIVHGEGSTYHEDMEAVFRCLSIQKKPLTSRRDT
jgi:tRNA1Val (adenine37-N6)-methyltransferase